MPKDTCNISSHSSIGTPPGTLIVQPESKHPEMQVIAYSSDKYAEKKISDPAEIPEFRTNYDIIWLNVDGLGDVETITRIGELFGFHELALEDVITGRHRAKVDDYPDYVFVVAAMVNYDKGIEFEQVSIFFGDNFIVTFQEHCGDCLDPVRDRLRKPSGKIRERGTGYLAYAILDALIDGFFPVAEIVGERLEDLEDEIMLNPVQRSVAEIHDIKRDLLQLRRVTWPLREVVNYLSRVENTFVDNHTRMYLRDTYDHIIQVMDLIENYRDVTSGLMDVYLSSVSNRMNEIMKVLTIIATLFMPLSFIASVYGMNYNTDISKWNMPELNWVYGYPFVLFLMACVAAIMLTYFYRRGWLSPVDRKK